MHTEREAEPSGPDAAEREEARRRAAEFGLEFLDALSDEMLDPSLVARLPVEWARSHAVLPARLPGGLVVLMADPGEMQRQKDLALLLGEEVRPVVAPRAAIMRGIERCYYRKQDSARDLLEGLPAPAADAEPSRRGDDLLEVAEHAPVTQLVNMILLDAVKARASDIHLEPFESRLRVRYRVDGTLYEQASPPKPMESALVSRLKVMAHLDLAEKRLPQDGMARVRVGEREIDIRVSTMPVAEGERVVLRLLDRDSSLLPLQDLGMAPDTIEEFVRAIRQGPGLILVTGPTGSGKTTTLYAALRRLDTAGRNVMTIEDPIEYRIPDIGQIQVRAKIGLDFARGLRHILRQDPDVILVGETRDLETAEIALRASLTGHLVFTTLHTNDAPSAVVRLLDMGVPPYLLAAALRAALAQRLVRRLCPECREPFTPGEAELRPFGEAGRAVAGRQVWRARGCRRCLGGYRGRTGVFELMTVGREIEDTIRGTGGSPTGLRAILDRQGMRGLLADGLRKALAGETSLDELLHAVGGG